MQHLDELLTLVPLLGVRLLAGGGLSPRSVLLFIDISGFTAISERFCEQSARGYEGGHEALEALLRIYFTQLNAVVDSLGGQTCKYAGDALLCVFEAIHLGDRDPLLRATEAALRVAALDFDCSDASVADALFAVGVPSRLVAGLRLRCKSVVCNPGGLNAALVGGDLRAEGSVSVDRKEVLLFGKSLLELNELSAYALVGHCICPEQAALALASKHGERSSFERLSTAGFVRLPAAALVADPPVEPVSLLSKAGIEVAPSVSLKALASLCIEPVSSRIQSGLSPSFCELRTCTVVFVMLAPPDLRPIDGDAYCDDAADVRFLFDYIDSACHRFQRVLARHGGSLRQAIQDDKGAVLIGVFGLPTSELQETYAWKVCDNCLAL
jgi:hypothetical protein